MPTAVRETCPGCGKPLGENADPRMRPFCSERCKMADLGGWFAERYSVPAEPGDDAEDPPTQGEPKPQRQ